jgi:hypothetical protein
MPSPFDVYSFPHAALEQVLIEQPAMESLERFQGVQNCLLEALPKAQDYQVKHHCRIRLDCFLA